MNSNSNPNRKRHQDDHGRGKCDRRHQEETLDDALMNTFPASDPVSAVQPTPPAADRASKHECADSEKRVTGSDLGNE
jgi:hypothetical protein